MGCPLRKGQNRSIGTRSKVVVVCSLEIARVVCKKTQVRCHSKSSSGACPNTLRNHLRSPVVLLANNSHA